MADHTDDRWKRLNLRPPPPSDAPEPEQPVLVDYVSDGRVAIITLNRPHADNAISTELAASLIAILEKIAANSPTAVQAVKRAVRMGDGQPIEQAVAIMMEAHWRSAVHPDRIDGIRAFNEGREPVFQDPDF